MARCFRLRRDRTPLNDPQDVSLRGVRIRSQDEVRGCEGVEVRNMAMDECGGVVQFPEFFGCRGRIDLIHCICGLTRGQVVYGRSNAADPRNNPRYLLDGHSFHEFLESP
jgi:hypothetical protein